MPEYKRYTIGGFYDNGHSIHDDEEYETLEEAQKSAELFKGVLGNAHPKIYGWPTNSAKDVVELT